MVKSRSLKSKTIKIYNLNDLEILIKGVKVTECVSDSRESVLEKMSPVTLNGPADGNCCSCCGVGPFETRAQQRAHYKQQWHTQNLKRKLFGKNALTMEQFNSRQDTSSASESDSEVEAKQNTEIVPITDQFPVKHCKTLFTNHAGEVFCLYKCILHHQKEEPSTDGESDTWEERCQRLLTSNYQKWAVLMISGGNFAGAIFAGKSLLVHKTKHSYVVRRGQGQAQSNRDQNGNKPRSAGASLRRNNQAQFLEHIRNILVGWREDLVGCELIFYRAVGSLNQSAIFGKNSPLKKDDPRVRQLPFPTRKPTLIEVQRVHETLATVEVYDSMESYHKKLISSKPKLKSGSGTSAHRAKIPLKKKSTKD